MKRSLALLLLPLLGCQHARDVHPSDLVVLVSDKDGNCLFEANGQRFRIPADNEAFQDFLGDGRGRHFQIRAVAEAPYQCMGGAIYAAQQAGYKVGFVAEPPP